MKLSLLPHCIAYNLFATFVNQRAAQCILHLLRQPFPPFISFQMKRTDNFFSQAQKMYFIRTGLLSLEQRQ